MAMDTKTAESAKTANKVKAKYCKGRNAKTGRPCRQYATSEDGKYCIWHDKSRANEAQALRSKGASVIHTQRQAEKHIDGLRQLGVVVDSIAVPTKIEQIEDLLVQLAGAMDRAKLLPNSLDSGVLFDRLLERGQQIFIAIAMIKARQELDDGGYDRLGDGTPWHD